MTPTILLCLGIVLTAVGGSWTLIGKSEQAQLLTKQTLYIAHQGETVTNLRAQVTDAQADAAQARSDAYSEKQNAAAIATLADKRKSDNVALAGYVKTLLTQLQEAHKADVVVGDAHE